jgi:hypothetical protein
MDNDFDTSNAKAKATERYAVGWTDWRGVYGTPASDRLPDHAFTLRGAANRRPFFTSHLTFGIPSRGPSRVEREISPMPIGLQTTRTVSSGVTSAACRSCRPTPARSSGSATTPPACSPGSAAGRTATRATSTRRSRRSPARSGQCVANRGDIILVKPGHAETISSATALTFSKAGVAIVGLGSGTNRPKFTLDTANTATINVTAANVSIQNCIFVGNFLSIATCFTVTAAPEFNVDRCDFRDTDATHGFLSIITTTVSVNADGLRFVNNRRKSDATTTPGPDIVIAGTIDRVTVNYNWSDPHRLVEQRRGADRAWRAGGHGSGVPWNYVYSVNTDTATGAILVKTTATTGTGIIAHNRVRALDVAAAIMIPAAAVQYGMFDNLYTGERPRPRTRMETMRSRCGRSGSSRIRAAAVA